jgi:tRNA-(ms[2]io[6]A)-hydroxylase
MSQSADIKVLLEFIKLPTPKAWCDYAITHIPELLNDHAHCERKAAQTAINMISKYPKHPAIIATMSPLAREELLHFEKVIAIMHQRKLPLMPQMPSTYASELHKIITKHGGKDKLRDELLIGAIIEARSCERFFALNEELEDLELKHFFKSLIKSEARHFEDYLKLAHLYGENVDSRLEELLYLENQLITQPDPNFRFHSGIPVILDLISNL